MINLEKSLEDYFRMKVVHNISLEGKSEDRIAYELRYLYGAPPSSTKEVIILEMNKIRNVVKEPAEVIAKEVRSFAKNIDGKEMSLQERVADYNEKNPPPIIVPPVRILPVLNRPDRPSEK